MLNVGAGAGSYEPADRSVAGGRAEPHDARPAAARRGARPSTPVAEALPFDDDSFDAAMACITIHHWQPVDAGLAELRRVARGPVAVLTFELDDIARVGSASTWPSRWRWRLCASRR